jgi:carboxypeptidase C (cathepsin A)
MMKERALFHRLSAAAIGCLLLAASPCAAAFAAQPAASEAPQQFVTHHQIRIGRQTIRYTATAGDIVLRDLSGDPIGSMFSFSYIKDGPTDEHRPVLFVFNGGPGSSSLWLHMGVVGPERVVLDRAVNPSSVPPFGVEANPDSLLDAADIVFIDPIGTGYSRIIGQGKPEDFYGVDEDANSVAQFMELWLDKYRRWNSPKFVMGESYGSLRAAILPRALMGGPTYLGMMRGIALNGIVLLGTTLNMHPDAAPSADEQAWHQALSLPGFAATAWYHQSVDRGGRTLAQFYDDADHYAQTDYLAALRKAAAGTLSDAEHDAVAARLSAYTGLPASQTPKDLKISSGAFGRIVLAGRGLDVGTYDSRYTLPALHSGNEPVADDPAMTQYVPGFVAAFHEMLGRDLNVHLDRPYLAIHWRGLLEKWNWKREQVTPGQSAATDLAIAMRRNPKLRVLVGGGYYDLTTAPAEALHDLQEAGVPSDRYTFKLYESGHMLYIGDTAKPFSDDVRALIRTAR